MTLELMALVGVASVMFFALGLHYDLEIMVRERFLAK